jgi:hypothetical protein
MEHEPWNVPLVACRCPSTAISFRKLSGVHKKAFMNYAKRTSSTDDHQGNFPCQIRHVLDDHLSIPFLLRFFLPYRKQARDAVNSLCPNELVVLFGERLRDHASVHSPFVTFGCEDIRSEEVDYLIKLDGFGESCTMGRDFLDSTGVCNM